MNISDGTEQAPRLVVYAHSWALQQLPRLPHQRAWTWPEALDRVAAAGYHGVQAEPERAAEILKRGLRFAAGGRAGTGAEVNTLLERCMTAGAECVTLHLGWGDEDDVASQRLVHAVIDGSDRLRLPAYIETHRATVVQDLWRTRQLIARVPEIEFNGDYSHYYCAGEVPYRGFESFLKAMEPVLRRTRCFHGRVSNGQVMQASLVDDTSAIHVERFKLLWQRAMQFWLERARPGDILPFVPELGPPASEYSVTYVQNDTRFETTDRWQEMLLLRSMAEACFAAAVKESARGNTARIDAVS